MATSLRLLNNFLRECLLQSDIVTSLTAIPTGDHEGFPGSPCPEGQPRRSTQVAGVTFPHMFVHLLPPPPHPPVWFWSKKKKKKGMEQMCGGEKML